VTSDVLRRAASFERVVFAQDEAAGVRAIVAIHSTRLGPSLGGLRMQPYPSEDDALTDVLRLAEAMTWKAASAGLDVGGGKSVVIADPQRDKTEALLRAFGRVVESLGGRYIVSVDVGTGSADMDVIKTETGWVAGASPWNGGSGDPSPFTAQGVAQAMRACLHHVLRNPSPKGRRIAIQGAGKVGYHLAGILTREGAEVVMADPNLDSLARAVSDFSVSTCTPAEILSTSCDVLAPCALGSVLDAQTIPRLACRAVCGAANNQLATPRDASRLAEAGILYAPDFIVNAGGLISVADELHGWSEQRVRTRVDGIGRTLLDVIHRAIETDRTTNEAAVDHARERIRTLSALAP
jgi:leucine dehydrogenase